MTTAKTSKPKRFTFDTPAEPAEKGAMVHYDDYADISDALAEALARVAVLEAALSDFVAMGESYGWDTALTGRNILMRAARAALRGPGE